MIDHDSFTPLVAIPEPGEPRDANKAVRSGTDASVSDISVAYIIATNTLLWSAARITL